MNTDLVMINALVLLIGWPLAASPMIYLVGRIWNPRAARRAGLIALAFAWVPFVISARDFAVRGPSTFELGAIALRLDGMSLLLVALALGLGVLVVLFSNPAMIGKAGEEKYYALLTALTGLVIALACASDLFNLWVWFEAMAVSSYLLVVFYRDQPASLEAGIKYLVQSATGSALALIGIALVLAQRGTLDLHQLQTAGGAGFGEPQRLVLLAAGALLLVGLGVKAALVPMHTWLSDAHMQAPSGVSALLSGLVIEAALIALLRALSALAGALSSGALLIGFGTVNIVAGNLLALRQTQVKRMLAFSSLSHVGYMLLGIGITVYTGEAAGAQGGLFHLVTHGLMKGLAFMAAGSLLYALQIPDNHAQLSLIDLAGAARRYPLAALALSIAALGLGGLPPLAGFISKWQIFMAGFAARNRVITVMVGFAALNSVLSLAYYAPLVNAVYRQQPSEAVERGRPVPAAMSAPLVVLALAILAIGVWPDTIRWLTEPAGLALLNAFHGWKETI